jgi:hypothetical protein
MAGCANELRAVTDFVTTPIVQPSPKAASGPSQPVGGQTNRELCDKLEFVTAMDVDSAYASAMRNFGFRTLEERKRYAERNSMGMVDDNFRHTAQPGALYRMTDYNTVALDGRKVSAWTSMELWRESAQQTAVKVNYCASRTDGSEATKTALNKAYRGAFK